MASRDPYARNRKRSVALRAAESRATEARAARRLRVPPLALDLITDPIDLPEEQSA